MTATPATRLPGPPEILPGRPDAVIDLQTDEGAALVGGAWRYADAEVREIDFVEVADHLGPGEVPNRTFDVVPHAEAADFDDAAWRALAPGETQLRLATGRVCFNWYRIAVTIPERVGDLDPTGATVVFETVIDDYSEVWVDGALPLAIGDAGGRVAGGFNAPNRVVLTSDAKPGQKLQIAVFGVNGPISNPPVNFIWIRSATLDFFARGKAGGATEGAGAIVRLDPAFDRIVPTGAKIEKLAGGFQFTEGPVWHPDGYLLFSDPNANTIYRWSREGAVSVYRSKSGYSGLDIGAYRQPGSNGLTLDRNGLLTINEHGNRRVTRLERPGNVVVLADRYQGKRLNSPNDLVYRSDGSLYFTDPPFGLPKVFEDPTKELPFSGVYRLSGGTLTLLTTELSGPNGIAFSPDERYLYVANWDLARKVLMRYEVQGDGTLAKGRVFHDFTSEPEEVALDGVKVDQQGNVYVSAPRGIWVLSPEGAALGRIELPEHGANMAWGDDDARGLYLTASTGLYRVRTSVPGMRPALTVQSASR
jgi:gluconolactonase